MVFAGEGAGGKKNAPAPMPDVSWNESRADTGSAEPLTNGAAVGETPSASSPWITKAVESGSDEPGVATVFGKNDHPPSGSCPVVKNFKAPLETVDGQRTLSDQSLHSQRGRVGVCSREARPVTRCTR